MFGANDTQATLTGDHPKRNSVDTFRRPNRVLKTGFSQCGDGIHVV